MAQPERFSNLPEYAFPRLRNLLNGVEPGGEPVIMTIGEPRHPMPDFVAPIITETLPLFGKYPPNEGTPELLDAIAGWVQRRYGVDLSPSRITALNGTREGLFNAALALCPEQKAGDRPAILIPNPFYQVYAVAAAAVSAQPVFVPATEQTGFLPNYAALDPSLLDRTVIAYICSPANPQGSVASDAYLERLLELADRHDFQVFSDECYSEIYRDTPPPGALAVADRMGLADRVVIFNSLSKRSNLPGLRSGFAAGSEANIAALRRLRSYSGAPVPLPAQAVSAAAWADEAHVEANRALYQRKYDLADRLLGNVPGYRGPEAGFFLWLPVEDGEAAAVTLWREAGIQVLPGAYLARQVGDENPGQGYIRVALVADEDTTARALCLLRQTIYRGA